MRKIYTILALIFSLLLLAVSTAWAFGEIRYPDRPLNLRKGRSAKSRWVGSLYPGQKVRVSFLKDGWVAVFEPGETKNSESAAVGYSNVKYLLKKQTRVEPKPWGDLVYAWRTLNVRSSPSIRGRKVDTLKAMEHVRIDFPEDDWSMVFSPDATIRSKMNGIGYSSIKYFKPATKESMARAGIGGKPLVAEEKKAVPPVVSEAVEVGSGQGQVGGTVAPPPAPVSSKPVPAPLKVSTESAGEPASWGKVLTVKRKVNIREKRTSGSSLVHTLKSGEKVRVDYLKNGWYAVFREDETVREESKALGYALQSLIEGSGRGNAVPVEKKADSSKTARAGVADASSLSAKASRGDRKTLVIDRSRLGTAKRPDPTPDKVAHGYRYRIVEKAETKQLGETWITIKVFLSTKKLPGGEALKDFSTTLWREYKRPMKKVAILVYLPGMDMEDLEYGVTKFDDTQLLEFWVRKATLFGTDFL